MSREGLYTRIEDYNKKELGIASPSSSMKKLSGSWRDRKRGREQKTENEFSSREEDAGPDKLACAVAVISQCLWMQ